MTENIVEENNNEKNLIQEDENSLQGLVHKEKKPLSLFDSSDEIQDETLFGKNRETKVSVQIHTNPDLLDLEEFEEPEKCYSMKEGSILGSVFTLSSLALGTSAFCIPIRCTQLGCVWYIILLFVSALAAYWTLTGLIRSSRSVRGEYYSITVRDTLGKSPALVVDIFIMIYVFGIFIEYMVIVYSLIGRTYFELFEDIDKYKTFEDYENDIWDRPILKYPIMLGIALLIFPICLLKDISKMRYASMFGICALIYSILVIVIESPWFLIHYLDNYKEDDPKTHANWFDISKGFTKELNFFTGIATLFFVFSCHPGSFSVFKTLKNNNEKRINKVFFRSILLDLSIFVMIGICGFITAPLNPKSLIIYRESIFDNDIFMTIAKIALALDLLLSLPANYAPFRSSIFLVFFKTDKIDNFKNFLVTAATLLISTLIGALYKNILSYISLLGGFCSSMLCYLMPGVLMVKTSNEKINSPKNIITITIIVILTSFGFMGGIQTIRSIINGYD